MTEPESISVGRSIGRRILRAAALLLPLLAGGCQMIDPTMRPGMWKPDQAVQQDLAAQVANPADLVRGHGAEGTPDVLAVAPVETLNAGKLPALPAGVAGGGSSSGNGPSGGGTSGSNGVMH